MHIFLKESMASYWFAHIIQQNIPTDEIPVFVWGNKIDFNQLRRTVEDNPNDKYICFDLGFTENQLPILEEILGNVDVSHFASWGEELPFGTSYVGDTKSPLKLWADNFIFNLQQGTDNYLVTEQDMLEPMDIVASVQEYHQYDNTERSHFVRRLAELFGKNLGEISHIGLKNMRSKNLNIERILETMKFEEEKYIEKKKSEAREFNISDTTQIKVFMVYAEKLQNEIAHELIEENKNQYMEVVVLIGSHTRGDDLFRVRVSEGISALDVAQELNNGKGKDHAATVFLGDVTQFTFNTIESILTTPSDEK